MLGKNTTHLLRLIGIIHFLKVSFEFFNVNGEVVKGGLTNELNEAVDKFVSTSEFSFVGKNTVKQAQLIIEYYNKNFMCLGGFAVSPFESLEDVLKTLSNNLETELTIIDKKFDEETRKNIKNVLISPGRLVDHT